MQDMSSFTISAAIGMWRCGAKNIEIAIELNLCEWEVLELIEKHQRKDTIPDVVNDITVDNKDELFNPDSKDNWLV